MKARAIDVRHSVGRVLLSTIFHASGKKLLPKGHRIEADDVPMLQAEALHDVWVAELEEGDVSEDEAVMQVASQIGNGSLEIRPAAGGRANLFATEPCCVLVGAKPLGNTSATRGNAALLFTRSSTSPDGRR